MGKLSVKCTPENKSNMGCFLNAEECVYCTKNGYCGDFDGMTHNEILNVFDRLGQMEDEAEQREQGCDLCKDIDGFCMLDMMDILYNSLTGEPCVMTVTFKYCPNCGRKLVKKNEN